MHTTSTRTSSTSTHTRRRRLAALPVVAALAATCALTAGAAPAQAGTSSATFRYTGESTDRVQFFDTGLVYLSGCSDPDDDPVTCFPDGFPGTAWFRVRAGVVSTVVSAQTAGFTLDAPDAFRADTTAPFTSTLDAVDADGKEVVLKTTPYVNFDVAYDEPFADCPRSRVPDLATLMALGSPGSGDCLDAVGHTGDVDITTLTLLESDTVLPYSGSRSLSQTATSPSLDVGALVGLPPGLLGTHLEFVTQLLLKATGGYQAQRVLESGGATLGTRALHWPSSAPQQDDAALSCAAEPGQSLLYKLRDNRWSGTGTASGDLKLVVEIVDPVPDPSFDLLSAPLYDAAVLATATDHAKTLGEVRAENKPPTVGVTPLEATPEGTPVTFTAVGTGPSGSFDNCDPSGSGLTFHWTFDDGHQAYGRSVSHAFADDNGSGVRTAHLEVVDAAGNRRDVDVDVPVTNAAPRVAAGPDTSAAWGRPVAFRGSATDPGAGDQADLTYAWSFGDGTPSATGGPDATHAYDAPGTYTATLTACDDAGACSTDTRDVVVRKRVVGLGWTGAQSGTHDTAATLAAVLTDEFGQPVAGRGVDLGVGGEDAGSATTDGAGRAARSHVLGLEAGTHSTAASFGGDPLYQADTAAPRSFTVARKATTTTYTGATSSRPNKVVSLTAVLADAEGTRLAGRTVRFQLGSQTATAVTDATGLASTTLKLAQRNGTYPVTATFEPAGPDATRYGASSDAQTFSLQS